MENPVADVEAVRHQYDWSDMNPSGAILEAISRMENDDVISLSAELDTTLFDHVDPDALDRLVTAESDVSVSFTFDKYHVQIDGNTLRVSYT